MWKFWGGGVFVGVCFAGLAVHDSLVLVDFGWVGWICFSFGMFVVFVGIW